MKKILLFLLLISLLLNSCNSSKVVEEKPEISQIIDQIDEEYLFDTVKTLESFHSRAYPSENNQLAGEYLFQRFAEFDGFEVTYHNDNLRNIIATYRGSDSSSEVYMVGAHYDSKSSAVYAPGATDNGIGVAIVLEFARIINQYQFKKSIIFALWNGEERSLLGSTIYVKELREQNTDVGLYINYDSAGYDPEGEYIIDLIANKNSKWAADMVLENHDLYNIGFKKINSVDSSCKSDYVEFWNQGYPAISTHTQSHGPAHTKYDTAENVSYSYARKNAQLGLSLLLELAVIE